MKYSRVRRTWSFGIHQFVVPRSDRRKIGEREAHNGS